MPLCARTGGLREFSPALANANRRGILRNTPVHRAIFGPTRLPAELIAAARFVNDCFRDGLATNCFDDATI